MIFIPSILTISLFCAVINTTGAQPARHPVSFPFTGSSVCSAKFADVFSAASNQAALCFMPTIAAGMYAENRFMIRQLKLLCLSIAFNGRSGALGVHSRYSGSIDYNESMLGLAYAKNLGAIKLGMQFNYHLFSTAGEARQSLMSMEIGAVLKLSECVNVALHLIHPASLKKGPTINGKIAYSYETILGYEVSPAVFLALQLNKEEDKPLNVITNLKYAFADQFFASLSLSTATQQPAAGAGWRWRNFRIELFISYHFQLGSSPGLFLLYQPGKIDPA